MTLDGLLAIIGIIVAIYALARPIQHQSIMLFVPWWVVLTAVAVSCLILLSLDGLDTWNVPVCPGVTFGAKTVAFVFPVAAGIWAVCRWHSARLSAKTDGLFRQFLLTSLREDTFDEAVRIVLRNTDRLASVLTKETADLLFDRRFVRALVAARSWVHLELLTQDAILEKQPNRFAAVDRTVRELLSADESPLRTAVLCEEGGDETLVCSDQESQLIDRTFCNPQWYMKCRVGNPLLMTARELLDSGKVDDTYNRNDLLYISRQGVSSRSRCPLFLGEKTIVYAVKAAIEQGVDGDFYVTDLAALFEDIYEHSRYDAAVWDNPPKYCGEFPTPFAYLLSTISADLYSLGEEAFRKAKLGVDPPGEIVRQIGVTWAVCLAHVIQGPGHAPDRFRRGRVIQHFSFVLETLHPVADKGKEAPPHLGAWQEAFLAPLKQMFGPSDHAARDFLTEAANHLDLGRRNIFDHEAWLRSELGLLARPRPQG